MEIAKVKVNSVTVRVLRCKPIPRGIVGAKVSITYTDPIWNKLHKTVVFRGAVTKDVVDPGELVEIPWETVEQAGRYLYMGIYGADEEGRLIIPTIWTELGCVEGAADPSGDTSAAPSAPVWAQIQAKIGNLSGLTTEARMNLVSAINELAAHSGDTISEENIRRIVDEYLIEKLPGDIFTERGGYYIPTIHQTDETTMHVTFTPSKEGMEEVPAQRIVLPAGADGKEGAAGPQGPKGDQGPAGADGKGGYTPVKGIDYFTEAEKEQLVQDMIEAIGLPVFGTVDSENIITLTGALADGVYTLKYEDAYGDTIEIGEITIGGKNGETYTNLSDPTDEQWRTNYRINSSKVEVEVTEAQRGDKTLVITNLIDISGVTNLHIKGLDIMSALASGNNYGRAYLYAGSGLSSSGYQPSSQPHTTVSDYDSSVYVLNISEAIKAMGYANTTHIRLGGILTGTAEDVIITADEQIM